MSSTTRVNPDVIRADELSVALNERCADLVGADAPRVKARDVRFLFRAGFDKEVVQSWCEKTSIVDVPFIVRSLHTLYDSLVIEKAGNPLNPPAHVYGRVQEMEESSLDKSLQTVELVFYAAVISDGIGYNNSPINWWLPLSVLYGFYSAADVIAMHGAGGSVFEMKEWALQGIDAETMLAVLSAKGGAV